MFSILKKGEIASDDKSYLSFPDVIKGKNNKEAFLIYRDANNHHPTSSCLRFLKSIDYGSSWLETFHINASLMKQGYVWNCPRLSYLPDGKLYIICDIKNHIKESMAYFKIVFIEVNSEGSEHGTVALSGLEGMVPDKFVYFGNKITCAAHERDKHSDELIQRVHWSRDYGKTFVDSNLLARQSGKNFCEASLVNFREQYLLAYLRENSKKKSNVYFTSSNNVMEWGKPTKIPIHGHRVTASYHQGDEVIGTFRNTKDMSISIFSHNPLDSSKIEYLNIEEEKEENIYNFGYSGCFQIKSGVFFVTYYLKQDRDQPFIGYAIVKR